jgi:signal transduction histidine kinase
MGKSPRAAAQSAADASAAHLAVNDGIPLATNVATNGVDMALRLRVESDRIAMLYRTNLTGTLLTMAMLGLAVLVAWEEVPPWILFTWSATVIGLRVGVDLLGYLYRNAPDRESNARRWGWFYSWAVLPSALAWGAAVFLPGLEVNLWTQTFVVLCLTCRMAASMLTHAYFPPALYTSSMPLLGALTLRYLTNGSGFGLLWAGLWLIVLVYILSVGHRQARLVVSSIKLRYENEQLIRELRQTNIAEAEARNKAEQASLAKSRFFAAANHDLRQPLHALGLFATTLRNSIMEVGKRQLVEQIQHSIESLESLFDDLLDISRLDAGQVKPRMEHFKASIVFDRIRTTYMPTASEKGLRLRVHPTEIMLFSDPALLFRILSNLVSNAIRYTEQGGVVVGIRRRNGKISVEVWDSGIGIPVDQQDKVFEEFYQLHNPERDRRKGLGLGLSTVKRVAALLDCPLTLRSRIGKGSMFGLEVPLGLEAQPYTHILTAEISVPDLLANRTIVVVDDEASVRLGMQSLLESWGCRCVATPGAQEAIDALHDKTPDFIIADFRLGDNKNGIEAVRALRAALGSNIPAVVLSGDTAVERLREVSAAGLTMLHKPLKAVRLRALLNHEFARKKH